MHAIHRVLLVTALLSFGACKGPEKPERRPTEPVPTDDSNGECPPSNPDCKSPPPVVEPPPGNEDPNTLPEVVRPNPDTPQNPPITNPPPATGCKADAVEVVLTPERIAACQKLSGGNACTTKCWTPHMRDAVEAELAKTTPPPTGCPPGEAEVSLTPEKIALCQSWGGGNACTTKCWTVQMKNDVEARLANGTPTTPTGSCICNATRACNIRSTPSDTQASIIGTLPRNQSVPLILKAAATGSGCTSGWAKVRFNNKDAYLCKSLATCN